MKKACTANATLSALLLRGARGHQQPACIRAVLVRAAAGRGHKPAKM
jgi:hypothetical protein